MTENGQPLFREQTLDRLSSPEQLTEYLRVTNPGIWTVLIAVLLLLAGIFSWAAVGTLETTADATVIVENHTAQVIVPGSYALEPGMPLHVSGQEYMIASASTDEYGRMSGTAEVNLPDGTYKGTIVVEQTKPIDFLLTSR